MRRRRERARWRRKMQRGRRRRIIHRVKQVARPGAFEKGDGMKKTAVQAKIREIRTRIKEYHKHKNDAYAYDPAEIDQVRAIKQHAVGDIEFLLAQLPK
jgi:hypothetical protein